MKRPLGRSIMVAGCLFLYHPSKADNQQGGAQDAELQFPAALSEAMKNTEALKQRSQSKAPRNESRAQWITAFEKMLGEVPDLSGKKPIEFSGAAESWEVDGKARTVPKKGCQLSYHISPYEGSYLSLNNYQATHISSDRGNEDVEATVSSDGKTFDFKYKYDKEKSEQRQAYLAGDSPIGSFSHSESYSRVVKHHVEFAEPGVIKSLRREEKTKSSERTMIVLYSSNSRSEKHVCSNLILKRP